MPAWVRVFCKQLIGVVTPDQLRSGTRDNLNWTLAEQYIIDDDLVDPALRIEPDRIGEEEVRQSRCQFLTPALCLATPAQLIVVLSSVWRFREVLAIVRRLVRTITPG